MLTPRFRLFQDDSYVHFEVHAPYTNVRDAEVEVYEENFLFVSSPYFLRLRLPGRLVDDVRSKARYVSDTGLFELSFPKETPGEHFENLDMITSLIAPRDIPDINPDLVQALDSCGITIEDDEEENAVTEAKKYTIGIGNKLPIEISKLGSQFPQLFELKSPEKVDIKTRHAERVKYELNKFSEDHYLADLFDSELLTPYIEWKPVDFNKNEDFNEAEMMILKDLPNKNFLFTKTEYKSVLLSFADFFFGYCYDKRTTHNESTVESSWTINKLSPGLTWFCTFGDAREVMIACYRRALIYPIFRNFQLCQKVQEDIVSLLRQGKKYLVKCLLDIYCMFQANKCEARYLLNQLFIKDHILFMQKCKREDIEQLANDLENVKLTKNDLGLELVELEEAAEIVKNEVYVNEIAHDLSKISLWPGMKQNRSCNDALDISDDSTEEDDSSSDDEEEVPAAVRRDGTESVADLDSDDDDPI